jgi:1-acyl-sn-glycerol-3-phosphate acyltransferase
MLYSFLKIIVGLALKIFGRKIFINNPEMLKEKGPLILACSHPNSFLDAVLLDVIFQQPIWSLTRGDAFISKFVGKILLKLRMLPVYRPSEGVENLSENYTTFDKCVEIFRNKGVVLIFSEGLCVNEWHLRSLKKGTARLAIKCQDENIPLKILPVGINYSSFFRFGKNIFINFGNLFTMGSFNANTGEGTRNLAFNNHLQKELAPLVFEIEKTDKKKQKEFLELKPSALKKIMLIFPSVLGFLIHAPLYLPARYFVFKYFKGTVHNDSVLIAVLLLTYPLYLLLIILPVFYISNCSWVFFLFLILPFTAWSHVQLKGQLDR